MTHRRVLDVSALPDYAFGHSGLIWWGTLGFVVIEASMLLLVLLTYFVLRTRVPEWPPGLPNPDLTLGTLNTVVLLASLVPNQLCKKAAEKLDTRGVRLYMPIMIAFAVAFLVIRAFEFDSLAAAWDTNAYGSIVWFIMGLHTTHLLTDFGDTVVLSALMYTSHVKPKRFVEVSENCFFWYFVVAIWMPVYLVVYFAPRWL
jgi:cytochrome c oxidase subunit III